MKIEVLVDGVSTVELETAATFTLVPELFDFLKVMDYGATKYAADNWLAAEAVGMDNRSCHASMFRHVAESYCGQRADHESGLHPLYHAATRALMKATKDQQLKRSL